MEKYEVSATNILIADLIIFEGINEKGQITSRRMTDEERFRKVFTIKGRFFDLETGEEYYDCSISDDGMVYGPVFANTTYVARTWRTKSVSESDLIRAALLLNDQLKLDELISKRKILLLPREEIL